MNRPRRVLSLCAPALLFTLLLPGALSAQVELRLRRTFIEEYKNKVTITGPFVVDKAHAHPNTGPKDGDLHIAGRSTAIQLASVAEIMNADSNTAAVDAIHAAEGSGNAINITGVWRIWAEHGGETVHRQGATLAPFTTTNPDHLFEIHPVLRVGDLSTTATLIPIDGYTPKVAADAFERYENKFFRLRSTSTTVTMTTAGLGFNYVEFRMVILEPPRMVEDGAFVMADVLDLGGDLLVRHRRMVFASDTPPFARLTSAQVGDTLHVLGVPRVDLALVSWRVQHAAERPEVLQWRLPYEMVIVGSYDH